MLNYDFCYTGYTLGYLSIDDLKWVVANNYGITAGQFKEITGQDYVA